MKEVNITRSFGSILGGALKSVRSRTYKAISPLNQKWFEGVVAKYGFRLVSLSLHSTSPKIHSRVRLFARFGNYLFVMSKRHGVTYTVKYLKACQLAIQKSVAGQPIASLRELEPDLPLPRLTKSGLPRIILLRDRAAIRSGSYSVVRMWLSFFSIYRVIKAPMSSKLNTITDPFSGDAAYLSGLILNVPKGMEVYKDFFSKMHLPEMPVSSQGILPILKASSDSKVSFSKILGLPKILKEANLWDPLMSYVLVTQNYFLRSQLITLETLSQKAINLFGWSIIHNETMPVGKLSFKEEAAGKLRVFAMVDCLTQSALFGLHQWLFELLRVIPNDGTFDQEASFKRAQDKAKEAGCSFGYDLSSATDRLPMSLQQAILAYFFGEEQAKLWSVLLVGRDYLVPPSPKLSGYNIKPGNYRYSVGQPMGAYSSWAMLAVTHHFIVQWAYRLAHPTKPFTWFTLYELLGDDIVIFDPIVAYHYLEIMKHLGVEINLSKSVVSNPGTVVEFAKRTSVKGVDVSAISTKMLLSLTDVKSKVEVALYLAMKTKLGIENYFKALHAFGPSALYRGSIKARYLEYVNTSIIPRLVTPKGENLFNFFACHLDEQSPEKFMIDGKLEMKLGRAQRLVSSLIRGEGLSLEPNSDQHDLFEYLEHDLKAVMIKKIQKALPVIIDPYWKSIQKVLTILLRFWFSDLSEASRVMSNGSDGDKGLAKLEQLQESIEDFIWMTWHGPQLFDGYNKLSKLVGAPGFVHASRFSIFDPAAQSLAMVKHQQILEALGELFTGALTETEDLNRLKLPDLYEILQVLETLKSFPKRFDIALDKLLLKGKPAPKEETEESLSIRLIKEFQNGLTGQVNRVYWDEYADNHGFAGKHGAWAMFEYYRS